MRPERAWALGWGRGYCICAAVLLGITIAAFDRRIGPAGDRWESICA
jgi:hypothetical protein